MPEIRTADFTLDAIVEGAKAVHEDADGDLIIEGYASDFGVDRQDEAFEPGAFTKAIDKFLNGQPSLLYHHHNDQQLGVVESLEERPDGLYMKARVAKPADSSPLADVYNKIRRGMMRGLSVRGYFKRRGAGRIYEADLAEISVTPFPVNPRTLFAVAQKAFDDEDIAEAAAKPATTEDIEPPVLNPEEVQQVRDYLQSQISATEKRLDELAEKVEAGSVTPSGSLSDTDE